MNDNGKTENAVNDQQSKPCAEVKTTLADRVTDFLECGYECSEQEKNIQPPLMAYVVSFLAGIASAALICLIFAAFDSFITAESDKISMAVYVISASLIFILMCISTFNYYKKVMVRGKEWMWQSTYRQIIAGLVVAFILYLVTVLILNQYLWAVIGALVWGILLRMAILSWRKNRP